MDRKLAVSIAKQYIPNNPQKIGSKDLKISKTAAEDIDKNKDGKISQKELKKALIKDHVFIDPETKVIILKEETETIKSLEFLSGDSFPEDNGASSLRKKSNYGDWTKELSNYDVGSSDSPHKGIRGSSQSGLTNSEISSLKGGTFDDALKVIDDPYKLAHLLDESNGGIKYQNERAGGGVGPNGTYSASEMIKSGTGICRDYHTLAVSILRENGYEAKMFGYPAADNVFHAFAVYQDPGTGKWGAIEYGKVYSPEMLNADSAEEAFLAVRPDAFILREYVGAETPEDGMTVENIYYTPTSRAYSNFIFSDHSGNIGITQTNNFTELSGSFGKDNDWEYSVRHLNQNSRTPVLNNSIMGGVWKKFDKAGLKLGIGGGYMPEMFRNSIGSNNKIELPTGFGFVSIEGDHPELVSAKNVGGSGININLNSRFAGVGTFAFNKSGDIKDENGKVTETNVKTGLDTGIMQGLSRFNWTPDLTINKEFDVWGKRWKK